MSEFLTLREAAEVLEVHYMTAYRYVRLGLLPAHKDGRTWKVATNDLQNFSQDNGNEPSHPLSRRNVPWSQRYENRLLAGDPSGAWRVLEGALSGGFSPVTVYSGVVAPALRSIGALWSDGKLGIEAEHQATRIVERHLGRMSTMFTRRGRRLGSVVVVGPPGDAHGIGLAMVSDVLRSAGYVVVELGPDTPVDALLRVIDDTERLAGLCIGASNSAVVEDVKTMIRAARTHLDRTTPIVVGGGAFSDAAEARRVGADALADIDTVVDAIRAGTDIDDSVTV